MKITSIDLIALKPSPTEMMRPIITRINTDEGIYGYGEAGMAIVSGATAVFEMLKDYAPLLIGRDPLDIDVIWEKLFKGTFWAMANGPVVMSAISALDTSLWDIKAKYMGVPLYKALGGKHRDKLRAYASQLQFGWGGQQFNRCGDVGAYRESVEKAVADGYDAVKLDFLAVGENGKPNPAGSLVNYLSKDIMHYTEERLRVTREVLGDRGDIIAENHAHTDVNTSIQFARMAEPYDIMFYEEPCIPLNPANFEKIAANTSIPVAGGERTFTRYGFLPFFQNGSMSVAQPDIGNCGGVTECKRICELAQLYDVSIQTHTCNSVISVAVALHVEAAIPNFIIHEHHVTNTFVSNTSNGIYNYQPVNGYFDIPEIPGIGQELSGYALKNAEIYTIR